MCRLTPLLIVPILLLTPEALAKTPDFDRRYEICVDQAPYSLPEHLWESYMDACLDGGPLDAYEEW